MQNATSVGIYTRGAHVFARLALICWLSRCLSTKFLHGAQSEVYQECVVGWVTTLSGCSTYIRRTVSGKPDPRKDSTFFPSFLPSFSKSTAANLSLAPLFLVCVCWGGESLSSSLSRHRNFFLSLSFPSPPPPPLPPSSP